MKKVATILAMLLLFAVCFTACGEEEDDAPDGMKRVSNPDIVGYSLYVPTAWISELNSGVVSAYHSQADASSVVMNQWNTEGITTPEEWWAQYVPVFEKTFTEFVQESDEECYLGGVKAHKYVYTAKMPAGDKDAQDENGMVQFRFMQVVTVRQSMVYVFTYTSTADVYESNLTDVQQMLDNFKFN